MCILPMLEASSGQAASNDPTITPSDDRGNAAKYSPASSSKNQWVFLIIRAL